MATLHNINTLLFDDFIACVCDNQYSLLIVNGKATEDELKRRFNEIFTEYNHLIGGFEIDLLEYMVNHVLFLENQCYTIGASVFFLRHKVDDKIIDILTEYAPEITFTPSSKDEFNKQLDHVQNNTLPNWNSTLSEARKELDEYSKKADKQPTLDRKYFTRLIVAVSRFVKYHIEARKITVAEFATYLSNMNETIELINHKNAINIQ